MKTNKLSRILEKEFLPGPLTLILEKKNPEELKTLTSGLPTLGVRVPQLQLNLLVAKAFGKPYTTTSANIS